MWLIALLFALQNPSQVAPPAGFPLSGAYRLNGRIVVDKGELPLVEVRLKSDTGAVLQAVQTFGNGTFRLDTGLGRYTVEVADARFNIATLFLWLREPEDASKEIVVHLVRNESGKAAETAELDFHALELDATIPAGALAEFKQAMEAIRNKSKSEVAEAHFKKAIQIYPDFYDAYFQMGLEYARQHKGAQALPAVERAVFLKPNAIASLSALGRLYVEGGQFEKGIATFLRAGSLGTLNADDRYYLGLGFYRVDNTVAAQQQFEQAIALAPNKSPAVYVQLHNAYMKNGKPAEALNALEKYLQLFPNDPNRKVIEENAKKLRASLGKGGGL
jgi:tetratricopeptide (TPR) repeat protein